MSNPFTSGVDIAGPAADMVPVTPSDTVNLPEAAVALYVGTGGTVRITTVGSDTPRDVPVADFMVLPVGVRRVHATGTTAENIFAMVVL